MGKLGGEVVDAAGNISVTRLCGDNDSDCIKKMQSVKRRAFFRHRTRHYTDLLLDLGHGCHVA